MTIESQCLCAEIDPSDRPCLVCEAEDMLHKADTLPPPPEPKTLPCLPVDREE